MKALKHLFTPGKIGSVEIPNRLVVTSMVTNYCGDDGKATEQLIDYLEAKERGGYGLIMSEALRVMVIGGGPAGLEVARAAALKGHRVELYERSSCLGGQFTLAAYPPGKGELASYVAWAASELQRLGVIVHLNSEINSEMVKTLAPDAVIVTSGSKPLLPPIPGINGANVVLAKDVLRGTAETDPNVVIAGGGMVGAETAAHLGIQGKKVVIVEMLPAVAMEESPALRVFLMQLLANYGVQMATNTVITGMNETGVTVKTNGCEKVYPADTIVAAFGYKPENKLAEELKQDGMSVTVAGDAVAVRKAIDAIREGYAAGLNI